MPNNAAKPQGEVKAEAMAEKIATKAVDQLVDSPKVDINKADKKEIMPELKKELTDVIMNQTNQEPWYQSRILLTQYGGLIVSILAVLGIAIEPDHVEKIIAAWLAVAALIQPALTIWARLFSKKPLTILGGSQNQ